jgi:hypothetical protein
MMISYSLLDFESYTEWNERVTVRFQMCLHPMQNQVATRSLTMFPPIIALSSLPHFGQTIMAQ